MMLLLRLPKWWKSRQSKAYRGDRMKIIVELISTNPDLTAEEIEADLRVGESQIGWYYDYKIKSIEVTD